MFNLIDTPCAQLPRHPKLDLLALHNDDVKHKALMSLIFVLGHQLEYFKGTRATSIFVKSDKMGSESVLLSQWEWKAGKIDNNWRSNTTNTDSYHLRQP